MKPLPRPPRPFACFGEFFLIEGFLSLFQDRVLFEFLANNIHKLHSRELKKFDRLLQLGGHHQLLAQFQLLADFKCHGSPIHSVARAVNGFGHGADGCSAQTTV